MKRNTRGRKEELTVKELHQLAVLARYREVRDRQALRNLRMGRRPLRHGQEVKS